MGEADRIAHGKIVLDVCYGVLVRTSGERHDGDVGPVSAEHVELCMLGDQVRGQRKV